MKATADRSRAACLSSVRSSPYAALPMRNIFAEQTGQTPWVAGRLFFIVMARGLLISLLDRHFTQYASIGSLQTRNSKGYPIA